MTHLEDGTLQAFLDDELPPGERAEVAEHLLGCPPCRAAHEELGRANRTFSEAVSLLDVEPPAAAREAPRPAKRATARAGAGMGSVVKAAGLVLAVAAAASAAVPGSPVRAWIEQAVEREPEPEPPVVAVPEASPAPTEEPADAAPTGVSILPRSGPAVIALDGLRNVVIRLDPETALTASVGVTGAEADPLFRTGHNRIEVREGAGGEVRVRLAEASGSRLEVDGEIYAEQVRGSLRILVPADTVDGAIVWR